jgi:hypothetical protein
MRIYDKLLGHPWVYDVLRPAFLGGIDFRYPYQLLETAPTDVVIDIGCGTGAALNYLTIFKEFHGFDLDAGALKAFVHRHGRAGITLYPSAVTRVDMERTQPTKGILAGVLHHLSDSEVHDLFDTLAHGGSIQRIMTVDPVYVPGICFSNVLAFLDRGRHVRREQQYRDLIQQSPFTIASLFTLSSNNGFARYVSMLLVPRAASNCAPAPQSYVA